MSKNGILQTLNELSQNNALDPKTKAFAVVFEAARALPYFVDSKSYKYQGSYPVDCILTFKPAPDNVPLDMYRQLNLFSALIEEWAQEYDIQLYQRHVFRNDDTICLSLEVRDSRSCTAFKLLTNNLNCLLREATKDKRRSAYEIPLEMPPGQPPFSL